MIVIIGAGPAGLAAAIAGGDRAVLLERNPAPGKKLLISGSGTCNFSNSREGELFLKTLGPFRNWLKPAFYNFDNQEFMQLLAANGCPVIVREDGKAFPESLKAGDVLSSLINLAKSRACEIRNNCRILRVNKSGNGFDLYSDKGECLRAERLIIAAGGAAWPGTGSDSSSYQLAQMLGHSILEPRPALASVEIEDYQHFKVCAGISLRIALTLHKKTLHGDLLFTHTGLSGPLILDNSWKMRPQDIIYLHFCKNPSILSLAEKYPKRRLVSIVQLLGLPQNLASAVLSCLKLPLDLQAAELTASSRKVLEESLRAFPLRISALQNLASAMSDYGGVDLKEVNSKSMESRIVRGLYFAGESLAYSLPSGGFSIQMAFSTGYLAGKSALNSI